MNLPSDIKTIMVRCPNWVGDAVMATPALDSLRAFFPQVRMVAIARRNILKILEGGPWFDAYLDGDDHRWRDFWGLVGEIRRVQPDLAIILPNSIRSVLPLWLGGAQCRIGYRRGGRGMLLSGGPEPRRLNGRFTPMPMENYYLELTEWLGAPQPSVRKPRLYIPDALQQRAEKLFKKYGITASDRLIGLNPGASFGSSKCWPAEYFAQTVGLLQRRFDAKIILFSGPAENDIARSIITQSTANIIDTSSDQVDLAMLKPLIRRCSLLVTNDTGPRHYAVAFDVPAVVVMGPTDPRWTASNLDRTIVLRQEMPCAPCHKKTCPTDHACMKRITPEMVLDAVQKLL
jgi:heptosyltransferase II